MSKRLAEALVAACASVLPARRPIGLHEPELGEAEKAALLECLASGWVSTAGGFVDRFERELAASTGSPFAIATANGTSALHTALMMAGVGRDDEVLVPALTFVATANAVSYCGAIPNFVDVDLSSLGVDANRLAGYLEQSCIRAGGEVRNRGTGRRIRALIVMHTFGHPTDVDALMPVCRAYGLALIEDAAESLGSRLHGRHTGTVGLLGTLSFNGNKIVTTGGGGAVLTGDPELAAQAGTSPPRPGFRTDGALAMTGSATTIAFRVLTPRWAWRSSPVWRIFLQARKRWRVNIATRSRKCPGCGSIGLHPGRTATIG